MIISDLSNKYVLLVLSFLSFGILAQCQQLNTKSTKINGVSFVASKDTINSNHIAPVIKVNANWVSIMPFGFMRSLDDAKLYYNTERQWYGEREEGVRQSIEIMHQNNIKVMLKPQIWIGKGQFTGHIDLDSEESWKSFENDYTNLLMLYAKLAEDTQTEMLCIGTELNSFVTKRPKFWMELITKIREVYYGEITYAENWDKINQVPFWDALDYIGVDAYFPISDAKTPGIESVKSKWINLNTSLEKLSIQHDTPILFTEFGYRSVDYAGKEPWDSRRIEGLVNEPAQAQLLQGLFESCWVKPWFAGGFLWKWFHNPEQLSDWQANRFCVHGKLAEDVVREFYKTH